MNGHSKIRNKGIANIFSQMGLVEAWGSGIKRILNAAEEYGLPKMTSAESALILCHRAESIPRGDDAWERQRDI